MSRNTLTNTPRVLDLPDYRLELHIQGCDCPACEPYAPSVPARLDAQALGKLTIAGVLAGHAIACAIWGPATVLRVLVANLMGAPL